MAARCLERDDFEGALAECRAGLAETPGEPLLLQKLAAVVAPIANSATELYQKGEYEKARPLAQRWCELNPDDPEAWNTLGATRLKLRDVDGGLADLRHAAALAPAAAKYRYNLAIALLQLGRREEARPLFAALVAQEPKNAKLAELLRRCQESPPPPK
jgi:Flp pilus assembly protein TadD